MLSEVNVREFHFKYKHIFRENFIKNVCYNKINQNYLSIKVFIYNQSHEWSILIFGLFLSECKTEKTYGIRLYRIPVFSVV
jgi:hypothetical protein